MSLLSLTSTLNAIDVIEMIISVYFDGDEDEKLIRIQHEYYYFTLGVFHTIVAEHLERGNHHPLQTLPSQIDHRTIQYAHDLFAGAFRYSFKHSSGYKKYQRDCILGMSHEYSHPKTDGEVISEWHDWLKACLTDEHQMMEEFTIIYHNQNSPKGYDAEDRLAKLIIKKFNHIPWINRHEPRKTNEEITTDKKNNQNQTLVNNRESLTVRIKQQLPDLMSYTFVTVIALCILSVIAYFTFHFISERLFLIPVAMLIGFILSFNVGNKLLEKCFLGVIFTLLALSAFYLIPLFLSFIGGAHDGPCLANRYC